MADNENTESFEDRVDTAALDLNDLVKLMRDITFHDDSEGKRILRADALDALARAVERVEEDLWGIEERHGGLRIERNKPALVA